MLTAKDEDIDQIVGLELGADDYVVKPVQPRVLLARIRTLLRRVPTPPEQTSTSPELLDFGRLVIHTAARTVVLDGQELSLTTQEYDLLFLLASHAGEVLSRERILNDLTGTEYDGLDRSVDIRISRLRKLLEHIPAQPRGIKTVRAQGYLFVSEGWQT